MYAQGSSLALLSSLPSPTLNLAHLLCLPLCSPFTALLIIDDSQQLFNLGLPVGKSELE